MLLDYNNGSSVIKMSQINKYGLKVKFRRKQYNLLTKRQGISGIIYKT